MNSKLRTVANKAKKTANAARTKASSTTTTPAVASQLLKSAATLNKLAATFTAQAKNVKKGMNLVANRQKKMQELKAVIAARQRAAANARKRNALSRKTAAALRALKNDKK